MEILLDFVYLLLILSLTGFSEQGEVFGKVAVALQLFAGARDGVAFFIEEVFDCLYDLDVFFTVQALPRSILGRRQSRELRFPISEDMGGDSTGLAYFPDFVEQLSVSRHGFRSKVQQPGETKGHLFSRSQLNWGFRLGIMSQTRLTRHDTKRSEASKFDALATDQGRLDFVEEKIHQLRCLFVREASVGVVDNTS